MELLLEIVGQIIIGAIFSFIGAVCRFPFTHKQKKFIDLMREEESSELGAVIFISPILLMAIYFIYFQLD